MKSTAKKAILVATAVVLGTTLLGSDLQAQGSGLQFETPTMRECFYCRGGANTDSLIERVGRTIADRGKAAMDGVLRATRMAPLGAIRCVGRNLPDSEIL